MNDGRYRKTNDLGASAGTLHSDCSPIRRNPWRWEIGLDKKILDGAADRMKAGRERRVPLPSLAVAILRQLEKAKIA